MKKDLQNACVVCGGDQRFMFQYRGYDYHRCRNCGMVTTNPIPGAEAIEAHYASKFQQGNYQLLRENRDEYLPVYQGYVDLLQDVYRAQGQALQDRKALDIGCFTGDFLVLLQQQGMDVHGLELQSEAIAIAEERLPGRVLKSDVHLNVFPEMQFDVISLLGVIEHLVDPKKMLTRCYELLAPGGYLMLETVDSACLLARLLGKYWPSYSPVEHIHIFSRRSFDIALAGLGFQEAHYRQHWKKLRVDYVYNMLQNFGPEFHRLLGPIYRILPGFFKRMYVPLYNGGIIVIAQKPA